ncbi:MAG: inorganic phosphate transporter [Enterobacteriaceae bacterium]
MFNDININVFLLILAVILVLVYELINGFHDASNAVSILVYTKSLNAKISILMSSFFNLLGVLFGGLAIAYSIVHLFSINFLININSVYGILSIFSILLSSISWNLFTWFFKLPTSSSHTLIGSILGVGIIKTILEKIPLNNNISLIKFFKVFISLIMFPIISSLIPIVLTFFLNFLSLKVFRIKKNKKKIVKDFLINIFGKLGLIISSIFISFFHGMNDGQKGVGIMMLVLMSMSPNRFILNSKISSNDLNRVGNSINYFFNDYVNNEKYFSYIDSYVEKNKEIKEFLLEKNKFYKNKFNLKKNINNFIKNKDFSKYFRKNGLDVKIFFYRLSICTSNFIEYLLHNKNVSKYEINELKNLQKEIKKILEYSPNWVIYSIAFSLSFGTMMGWKRIAITVGKKIGKNRITRFQGIKSQFSVTLSMAIANYIGLPVSTTQLVSSSVVGSIVSDGNKINKKIISNIIKAWLSTIPISSFISISIYYIIYKFLIYSF